MLGYDRHTRIDAKIATDSTFTTGINIRSANKVLLEIPTVEVGLSTGSCNVFALVSATESGTYRRLHTMGVYSAASGLYNWEVPSTIGNIIVNCAPVVGCNWVKFELATKTAGASVTATAALSMYVHVIQ